MPVALLHPMLKQHYPEKNEGVFSKTSILLLHPLPTLLEYSEGPFENACCAVASTVEAALS
jgi:hypothetical protein